MSELGPVRVVRLPRSVVRRDAITFCKLLCQVRRDPQTGFDFVGRFLRPGARMDEAELWPAPQYPAVPVLLECAGSDGRGWGHRRSANTYILWLYERTSGEWAELARAVGQAWEWCYILGPVAARVLAQQLPIRPPAEIGPLAERIRSLLEGELSNLPPEDRSKVLGLLHDQLAARLAA